MIISRSNSCPYCGPNHSNSCYIVYDNGDHCYSCGKGAVKDSSYYAFRPQETVFAVREQQTPEHTLNTKMFDPEVLQWLYSYYVYDDLIKASSIAYCPPQRGRNKSLILPILDNSGNIIEYQRRFFPKAFYSTPGVKNRLFIAGDYPSAAICLVEDYISAIRVGEIMTTLCLFGTSLPGNIMSFIANNSKNVYIWMDNDEPGRKASTGIHKKLNWEFYRQYNLNAYAMLDSIVTIQEIYTDKQPKEHSPQEIQNILNRIDHED